MYNAKNLTFNAIAFIVSNRDIKELALNENLNLNCIYLLNLKYKKE